MVMGLLQLARVIEQHITLYGKVNTAMEETATALIELSVSGLDQTGEAKP